MTKWALAAGFIAFLGLLGWAPAWGAPPPEVARFDVPHEARIVAGQTLSGSPIWSGDLRVVGPVVVPTGAALTLQPGTRVFFDLPETEELEPDSAWITVHGRIHAEGTEEAPILFTPVEPRQNPLENMVDVREAQDARFRHCVFRRGPWGLHLHDTRGTVEACRFWDNYGGVRGRGGEIVLRANRFEGNRIGVRLWRASPVIEGNSFVANLTGIFFRQEVEGALVRHNNFGDLEYAVKLGELQTSDVDASNNWWGAADSTALAQKIFDGADSEGVGRVIVEPRLSGPWAPRERRP
ncbi:MAG: right-handed parallel beta-helix repeat-containing protein [Thermodesulfobacteriota bacterium]